MYNKDQQEVVNNTAEKLKSTINPPEWSLFVKTGVGRERPPSNDDWWFQRAASILRRVHLTGPIGVNKLKTKYGSKKNRGHKPDKFYEGSGKIIRTILQQLEEAKLIQKKEKSLRKGRIITKQGISLLEKNESRRNKAEKVDGNAGKNEPTTTGTEQSGTAAPKSA